MIKKEYDDFLDHLIEKNSKSFQHWNPPATRREMLKDKCDWYTREFVEKFPGLRRQSGFANGIEHWWCVDPDGNYVDPTAEQFRSWPDDIEYEELDPLKHEVLLGKCADCGMHIYGKPSEAETLMYQGSFCDEECAEATANYLRSFIR